MGIKYIRNTDDATIVCKIPSDKNKAYVFRQYKFNQRDGIVEHNGFTEISEEDLAILREQSTTFQYYEKEGKLTLADNLPQEAMSPDQLISVLRSEIEILKAGKESDAPNAEVAALKEKIKKLEKDLAEQQDIIDGLNEQIAEIPAAKIAD